MEVMFNKCLYLVDLSYVNEISTATINYFSKETRLVLTDTQFGIVYTETGVLSNYICIVCSIILYDMYNILVILKKKRLSHHQK